MDNRNINEEDNVAYDRDATLANKVSNKIVLPEVENNSAKLLQESTPQGVPVVSNMDKARIRYNASPGNAIMNDIDVRNTLDNAKTSALKEYDEGKAQRDKEAKEKADAEAQEAEEAKHRKAEKMWSAIGDGISAIANMATVGAGADSMYNPADSLHSKVKSKWDEIKANKAAVAAANRKAQMDLLLKDLELGVKSKEAEANRNFNIWKTETEEAGRNQRAKTKQEFDAEQNELNRKARIEAAKKGRSVNVSGNSSASDYSAVGPDGKVVKWKEKSQAAAELRKWIRGTGNEDAIALLEDRPYERSLTYDELYDIWEQYKK